jgi:hypothetical protein
MSNDFPPCPECGSLALNVSPSPVERIHLYDDCEFDYFADYLLFDCRSCGYSGVVSVTVQQRRFSDWRHDS